MSVITRFRLLAGLAVGSFLLLATHVFAQIPHKDAPSSSDAFLSQISESTSIELGLVLLIGSLCLAVGVNWERTRHHIANRNLHLTREKDADLLTHQQHAALCVEVRAKHDAALEAHQQTTAALDRLTRAVIAAVPGVNERL